MAALRAGCAVCRGWAEQDEGPYRRDDGQPERRDVVEDRVGTALRLGVRLIHDDGSPVPDARVEIWHCDPHGRYSGFPPPQPGSSVSADTAPRGAYFPEQTFLRGGQPADTAGMVEFCTIYPGWYPGRTVHVHLVVHAGDRSLTSQLYFPDEVTDTIFAAAPYAQRPGRVTTNDNDEIISAGGDPAVVDTLPTADGYRAAICLVLPGGNDAP